jgi:hypothetical protein
MPTIADLNQKHPSYDAERQCELRAIYEGDQLFEQRIKTFLLQEEREPPERYSGRCKRAHYRNYVGPIVDFFASMLFASRPIVKAQREGEDEPLPDPGEYYNEFREDCDRGGTNIDAFFKARLTDAMVGGVAWLRLSHANEGEQPAATKADFEARKLGDSWLETVDACDVYDWDTDNAGRLLWAIVHRVEARRASLSASRNQITETWDYLLPDRIETYSITYDKDKPPDVKAEVPRVGGGPHRYGSVPLVCLSLPSALWVASRLRSPQLAHFRASNAQSHSLRATAYAMPVAKVADPEAFAKALHGAGYGIVIGKDEDWAWEAPPSGHFAALDTEIKSHKDEIFRIANQMALGVENNAAAVGRSAESKVADAEQTRVALVAFSRAIKECIEYTLELISAARGDQYDWSVEGLDDFAALDVPGLVETLEKIKAMGGVPSRTFNVQVNTRVAEALLRDASEEVKATIRKEIEDGTPEPGEELEAEVERLHALASGLNGNGEEKPGGDRSGGGEKPPQAFGRRGRRPAAPPPSS